MLVRMTGGRWSAISFMVMNLVSLAWVCSWLVASIIAAVSFTARAV